MSGSDFDKQVIVIGSGFGGAVAAARLAEGGLTVTVLERGPWRDTVPVRSMGISERSPLPRGRQLFSRLMRNLGSRRGTLTLNKHGLFEYFLGRGVNVICSSGVGGGSHVYSAINVRPLVADYWAGHDPELSNEVMEPHYRNVIERLGSMTPLADHRIPNTSAARFAKSEILGPLPPPPDPRLGVLLPDDPDAPRTFVNADGIERSEVNYAAGDDGFLGSPSGAKTTLDFAYLAPAMKAGLTVRALCEVSAITRIETRGGKSGYRVSFTDHQAGHRDYLEAPRVIVAAGTLNTLRILFESRDRSGGLGGMPRLGQHFGTNGDFMGFWDYNEPGTNLSQGLPSAGGVMLRDDPDPPVLGGGGWPSVDAYPLPRRIRERLRRGTILAGMGEDAMDGVVSYRRGKLSIEYDASGSPIFEKIRRTVGAIVERTGKRIYSTKKPITVHPTGGACLADSIERGVVNHEGEVFDHPGLYVADAAALPRAPGGPPSLSIAAWSDHVASRLLARVARES